MTKKIFKFIMLVGLIFGVYVIGVILYGTINDWSPADELDVKISNEQQLSPDSTFTFLSWNIGFTGLGKETSFFYDGGETVIQTEELVRKNLDGIRNFISSKEIDFWLFQEVDSCSARSHRINHIDCFKEELPGHSAAFTLNYNVDFIPLPLTEPMGEVRSGLLNLSRYEVKDSKRYRFNSQFEWPRRVFFLDRCFLVQEVPLKDDKNLVVINTHCSAYDTDGSMVRSEVEKIVNYANSRYTQGDYVVVGGDWNQCPPGYDFIDSTLNYNEKHLSHDQIPKGWKWVADLDTPSNRKLDKVYSEESYTSIIDHYLVSPNVGIEKIETIDLDFEFSDHQPVYLEIKILP